MSKQRLLYAISNGQVLGLGHFLWKGIV